LDDDVGGDFEDVHDILLQYSDRFPKDLEVDGMVGLTILGLDRPGCPSATPSRSA